MILAAISVAAIYFLPGRPMRTYSILDGNRVVIHTTRETHPPEILKDAGMALEEQDTYRFSGSTIAVNRLQHIRIDCYGTVTEVVSSGETVGQLLTRLDMVWQPENLMDLSPDDRTYDGMQLRLARVLTRQEDYSVVLHCKTVRCFDPMLPMGTEQVLTEGKNGELRCRAEVTYRNGREVSRNVLEETVTMQPVDGVIAVGTGQALKAGQKNRLPVAENGILRLPTGEVLMYHNVITSLATAYCDKGLTATGTQARVGAIAVDPDYIPYGTRMFIMTLDGEYVYGIATAEDCGSKEYIHDTRIDLHFDTYKECRQFGARWCRVYILS